jgi:hypothetical protein
MFCCCDAFCLLYKLIRELHWCCHGASLGMEPA